MRRMILPLLIVATMVACAPKQQFILLPDPDGKVGSVTVSSTQGSRTLSQAYQTTGLDKSDVPLRETKILDLEKIETIFKEALAIAPDPPLVFTMYFKTGSTALMDDSVEEVQKILAAIEKRRSTDIEVSGHTDRVAPDNFNQRLSMKRAQVVSGKLTEAGVDEAHIQVTYHGEGNPKIETKDDVAEPLNRRVEVTVR